MSIGNVKSKIKIIRDITEVYEIISCILLSMFMLRKLNTKKVNIIIYGIKNKKEFIVLK